MKTTLSAAALVLALGGPAAATSVTFEIAPSGGPGVAAPVTDLALGDALEITLATAPGFGAFTGVNVDVTYDADALSYRGASFSPAFDFAQNAQEEPAGAAGVVTVQNITAATLFGGGSGAADLVTLQFTREGIGATTVSLGGTAGVLVVGPSTRVDAALSVEVAPAVIPLPASAMLLAAALAALGVARTRRG